MFRSSNPVMRRAGHQEFIDMENTASYQGLALKSIYFIVLTIAAACVTFFLFEPLVENTNLFIGLLIAGPILAFVCAMIASFVPRATAVAGSFYAILQGLVIGCVSALVNQYLPGAVFGALASTLGVFLIMMILYAVGAIKVGHRFRSFMMSALLGVVLLNLILLIVGIFVPSIYAMFYGDGILSLIICIAMILLASFMILIDLDNMSRIVKNGMSRRYEWLGAFGLIVTIIWLYMQFLRLFLIIAARRN